MTPEGTPVENNLKRSAGGGRRGALENAASCTVAVRGRGERLGHRHREGYMWFPGDSWWVEEPRPAVLWRVNGSSTGTAHVSPNLMLIYRKPDAVHLGLAQPPGRRRFSRQLGPNRSAYVQSHQPPCRLDDPKEKGSPIRIGLHLWFLVSRVKPRAAVAPHPSRLLHDGLFHSSVISAAR